MWGLTEQAPLSGWQLSEWPLHSHSSQCPRYSPPPVRVYPGAQSCGKGQCWDPQGLGKGPGEGGRGGLGHRWVMGVLGGDKE